MHLKSNYKYNAILFSAILAVSVGTSMLLMPTTTAHTPGWNIPTYAYLVVAPNPIGIGQETHVYMWLDPVYGAAGGAGAAVGTNASTSSAALTANSYRFKNYQLTITDPDGVTTSQTFATIGDTTSSQFTRFTPDKIGTYTLNFTYPGQIYGENGNGYEGSSLMGDRYLGSTTSTTLTVQEEPIPPALGSSPLPTSYWTHPIYGEGTDWWTISSNWLGRSAPVLGGYTSSVQFQADGVGPLTSHIMWTRPLQFGGVVGGNPYVEGGTNPNGAVQGVSYFEGSSYEPRFTNPIIISGVLYYTEPISFTGPVAGPTVAVDLRTGKVLWSRTDVPPLSFGYIYNLWNGDQHGTFPPILFTSNFARAFDAYTGDQLFNVTNVPSGTSVAGPSGEILRYVFNNAGTNANPKWHLAQWNSTKLWQYDVNPYTGGGSFNPSVINASNLVVISSVPVNPNTSGSGYRPTSTGGASNPVYYGDTITVNANIPINSTTLGGQLTGSATAAVAGYGITTYDWNISLPWVDIMPIPPTYSSTTGEVSPGRAGTNPVSVVSASYGDLMLCRNGSLPIGFKGSSNGGLQNPYTMFAINLNASRGAVGSILWMKTYDPPAGNITMSNGATDFQKRVFYFNYQESLNWVGYSLDTGEKLWTTPRQDDFDYYGVGNTMLSVAAYGTLYTSGFSGTCRAYDIVTGQLLWTYGNGGEGNSTNAGLSLSYGHYPTFIQSISNNVIYLATNEHTIPNPLYKGCKYTALNATTGEQIWQLSGYPSEWSTPGSAWAVADGYLTCMNGLDNNVYSIGRGPSQSEVTASPAVSTLSDNVVIRGTVVDISAGTKQDQQAANYPKGVPVAADSIMGEWMGFVYQQKEFPTHFEGVPVTIDVIDSNGNYRNIGTATTDATGMYSYTWTPDIPGDFTVIATFAGTNSYWPSVSETTFNVMETAPTSTPVSTQTTSMTDQYFIPAIAGLFILNIIVLALVLLRQKK